MVYLNDVITRREFLKLTGATLPSLFLVDIASAKELPPTPRLYQFYPQSLLEKFEKYKTGQKIPTICPYCAVGCGMIATVVGGKVIDIEGDPYHPINEGTLCSKGNAYLQLINSERRILYPMKRTNPRKGEKEDPGWVRISWDEAFNIIAGKIKKALDAQPYKDDKGNYYYAGKDSPIAWHGSAYWNNEECYLSKKLMSLLGSLNIEHQARKCHASTVVALANTFGFGASVQGVNDAKNAKCIMIMGSNAAEQHPIYFRWVQKAREDGAIIISLDPRYTRSSSYAHIYARFRAGTDAAIMLGIIRYVLYEKPERIAREFLDTRTNAPYNVDDPDVPKVGLDDPTSVFSKLRKIVEPYTPEEVEKISGIPAAKFREIADTYTKNRPSTILYSMGTTQHTNASHMIRAYAILQLVLGNIGPGTGIHAIRGISNVQGSTDMNVLAHLIAGYRVPPRHLADVRLYQKWKNADPEKRGGNPDPDAVKYPYKTVSEAAAAGKADEFQWGPARMFMTWNSLEYNWGIYIGTWPGKDPDNEPVVCDLPIGVGFPTVQFFRAMRDGKIKIAFIVGENNAVSNANANLIKDALTKCEFLVAYEIFDQETSHFADILLPGSVEVERDGSLTNTGKWIQWRWKAADPPGQCMSELKFQIELFRKIRQVGVKLPSEKFKDETGNDTGSDPDECWPSLYGETAEDVHKEIGAPFKAAVRLTRKGIRKATVQLPANMIYRGSYNPDLRPDLGGILPKRRDITPVSEYDRKFGLFKNWAYSWMDNQRNLYDIKEDPPGLRTFFAWWATSPKVFLGLDKAAIWSKPLYDPAGVRALIDKGIFKGKPEQHPVYLGIPVHNEPVESPSVELVTKYPTIWDERFPITKGSPAEYPTVLTTFRLTEHMQAGAMTRNLPWQVELQPEMFVEISPDHATELGVKSGDYVTVKTIRGSIKVKAIVTERIQPLTIAGKKVHNVAMPWHWGFKGLSTGPSANELTIDAVDIHANIPETKVALCKVERA